MLCWLDPPSWFSSYFKVVKLSFCECCSQDMSSKVATTCCSVGYDVLTIFISIADVVTDVIVLIDFYNKDRMAFFIISIIILILAQCSYSIAFGARFNTVDAWEWGAIVVCIHRLRISVLC